MNAKKWTHCYYRRSILPVGMKRQALLAFAVGAGLGGAGLDGAGLGGAGLIAGAGWTGLPVGTAAPWLAATGSARQEPLPAQVGWQSEPQTEDVLQGLEKHCFISRHLGRQKTDQPHPPCFSWQYPSQISSQRQEGAYSQQPGTSGPQYAGPVQAGAP